jgi:hypothetical protein
VFRRYITSEAETASLNNVRINRSSSTVYAYLTEIRKMRKEDFSCFLSHVSIANDPVPPYINIGAQLHCSGGHIIRNTSW